MTDLLTSHLLGDRLPDPGCLHHRPGVHQTEAEGVTDVVSGAVDLGINEKLVLSSRDLLSTNHYPPVLAPEVCSPRRPHDNVLDISPGEAGGGLQHQGEDASSQGRGRRGPGVADCAASSNIWTQRRGSMSDKCQLLEAAIMPDNNERLCPACGGNLLVSVGAAAVGRGQGGGAGLPVPSGLSVLASAAHCNSI